MTKQRFIFVAFILICAFGFLYLRGQLQTEAPQVTPYPAREELMDGAPPLITVAVNEDSDIADTAIPAEDMPLTALQRMEAAVIEEPIMPDFSCNLAPVSEVTENTTPRIYQWRDAEGRLHFSDSPPIGVTTTEFNSRQPVSRDYFQLAIEFRGGNAVPYFRGQIESQAISMYEILADFLGDERLKQVELNVIIFSDNVSYRDYATSVGGVALANAGGFYSNASNEAVTFLYPNEEQTMAVSRHEAAHVILNGLLATGPLWLHEGIAEYFEQLEIQQQLTQVSPNSDWLGLASTAIESGYISDLSDFLDATPEQWRNGQEAMNYALSWSLVYFMLDNNDGRRAFTSLLQQTANAYCTEISSSPILEQTYPGGLAALQANFFAWLMGGRVKRIHNY